MEPLRSGDPGQVGPYRLEARLGAGGMGRVFLGTSPGGREVAVKVIRAEHADDPRFRRRFAREVEAARRVGGFHTAQVVDADPEAPSPWMVTAFIPGPSLHQVVGGQGTLAAGEVRALAVALAEGLVAIHACGLVHRDLKPGNVIMAPDGPRIIDFGIARATESTSMTSHDVVIGSYTYMSPEQVLGEPSGPPSDVFSLGCVLAYAATGRSPFDAESIPAIVHRVLNEEPDLSALPGELRALVAACLARDPAARPAPSEIAGAPEHIVAPLLPGRSPVDGTATSHAATMVATKPQATPVPASAPAARGRGPVVAGIAAAAVLALVTVLAVIVLGREEKPPSAPVARPNGLITPIGKLTGNAKGIHQIAFSPDGRSLASGGGDGTVRLWDLATRRPTATLTGHRYAATSVAFSPDGRTVASGSLGDDIRTWDLATRRSTASFPVGSIAGSSVAFSPDGRTLASADRGVRLWDLATGRRRATADIKGIVRSIAFSPDGRTLAAEEEGNDTVHLLGTSKLRRTGALTGRLRFGGETIAFSPDGRRLANSGGGGSSGEAVVRVWDVAARRTMTTIRTGALRPQAVAFSPDGRTVAAALPDKTIRLWDAATGRSAALLTGHTSGLQTLAFSPDGTTVAGAGPYGLGDSTVVTLWKVR